MSLLDGLLGQVAGNPDLKNLAGHVGLTPEQVQTAIAALAKAHPQPGDTVSQAAGETGLSPDTLQQIVRQLGGEGALGHFASLLAGAGAGGGAGGLLGSLGGLFNKP
jgi:DNA-binding IscR family transcriptional regulator